MSKNFFNNILTNFLGTGKSEIEYAQPESPVIKQMAMQKEQEILFGKLQKEIKVKKDLINRMNSIKDSDIVQTVNDIIIDDGFNNFVDPSEFKIKYVSDSKGGEVKKIQEILDAFVDDLQLHTVIANIMDDLLNYGEYTLTAVKGKKGEGYVKLLDNLEPERVLPIYDGVNLSGCYYQKGGDSAFASFRSNFDELDVDEIAHFSLAYKKIRLQTGMIRSKRIPKFIRVGRPLVYSAMKLIERLSILETVYTAIDLKGAMKPSIVSVGVPSNTTPESAQEIVRKYEKFLNDAYKNTAANGKLDLANILATASRIKPIPLYADSKGGITPVDVSSSGGSTEVRESVEFGRRLAACTIGIPAYCLVPGESGQNKQETLKTYSRYTRKLMGVQASVGNGMRDLAYKHLKLMGVNVVKNNIRPMLTPISSADAIEDIEMMVAAGTSIRELYDSLDTVALSESTNIKINSEKFLEFFDDTVGTFAKLKGILEVSKPDPSTTETPPESDD